jgi:ATP-dependent DNA helicase RecG
LAILNKRAGLFREAHKVFSSNFDNKVRTAWCWYDFAKTLDWLRSPESEILNTYSKAMELLPDEPIFIETYERWRASH